MRIAIIGRARVGTCGKGDDFSFVLGARDEAQVSPVGAARFFAGCHTGSQRTT